MSENIHIKRRQRKRNKPVLTTRHIIILLVLCLGVFAGFRIWVGNPTEGLCEGDCESLYSLNALVIGFFMMIGAAIAAGGLVGAFWAFLRRRRQADGFEAMLRDGKDDDQGSTGT